MVDSTDVFPPGTAPRPEAPRLKTYAEMVFSRGSGGRPTVSCFWCDSRSVQAYTFRKRVRGRKISKAGGEGSLPIRS